MPDFLRARHPSVSHLLLSFLYPRSQTPRAIVAVPCGKVISGSHTFVGPKNIGRWTGHKAGIMSKHGGRSEKLITGDHGEYEQATFKSQSQFLILNFD